MKDFLKIMVNQQSKDFNRLEIFFINIRRDRQFLLFLICCTTWNMIKISISVAGSSEIDKIKTARRIRKVKTDRG